MMNSAPDWQEQDWIMLSALEHTAYCSRQCALIHVEKIFEENIYTLRGHRLHEKVDIPESEIREGVRLERALPLVCEKLGIYGKADMVEIDADGTPYPIEYKHGSRKTKACDDIQLCAQAFCLEEMFACEVPKGAVFYFSSRKRREVFFNNELRALTRSTILETRNLLQQEILPSPVNDERCPDCSLIELCLPQIVGKYQQKKFKLNLFSPLEETQSDF